LRQKLAYDLMRFAGLKVPTARHVLLVVNGNPHGLDLTADAEIPSWVAKNFEVDLFIDHLVVANFISHWDSLPQRPKNYWLYQHSISPANQNKRRPSSCRWMVARTSQGTVAA
jgi:hypothetical protein